MESIEEMFCFRLRQPHHKFTYQETRKREMTTRLCGQLMQSVQISHIYLPTRLAIRTLYYNSQVVPLPTRYL